MFNTLLNKLIKTASGKLKMLMATVGLSIAVCLILFAIQLQVNFNTLLNEKNNKDSIANFLVINKVLNSETIGATSFSINDIENFKKQNFVEEVSSIMPSRFKASIQSNSSRFPFYTDIAFESVPASFIDVSTEHWHWDSSSQYIPLIAPNMFLDFYNFQFSFSQNMPQLTPEVVKMIGFTVNIETPLGKAQYPGRIVGFSNRITSLLVPEEFMIWGNQFAKNNNTQASRIIIKTKDAGNPELVNYLEKNGYTTDADKTRFSKYRNIVFTVASISWVTGAIMLCFALLVFALFIQLTITACQTEIQLLVTLGASPKQLKSFLLKQFFPPNIFIVILSLLAISLLQFFTAKWLSKINMFVNSYISVYTISIAILLLLVLWLVNVKTIGKYVKS